MGYCSQVAFAIDKELYAEHKLIHNDFPEIWESHPQYIQEQTGDYIIFYIDSIKWYDHFPEISKAILFMNHLDDKALHERYGYMRLGEEFGDLDDRGDTSKYDLYVNQSISIG